MSDTKEITRWGNKRDRAAASEIRRLHNELWDLGRRSLEKAICIGELLTRVRRYRQGEWLVWLKLNVDFSDDTARNYMRCFEKRVELKAAGITNLLDAYDFERFVKRLKSTGETKTIPNNSESLVRQSITATDPTDEAQTDPSETENETGAVMKSPQQQKSLGKIMDKISRRALDKERRKIREADIHQRLVVLLKEVGELNQVSSVFMSRLIGHSKALV